MPVTDTTKTVVLPFEVTPVHFVPVYPGTPREPAPLDAYTSNTSLETMYEEYTPNSQGSHREWKSFEHFKSYAGTLDPTGAEVSVTSDIHAATSYGMLIGKPKHPYFGYDPVYVFGNPGRLDMGLEDMYVKRSDGGFVPAPANLDDLVSRSLKTMLPAIKAELSLVNSVLELKDLRSLKQYYDFVVRQVSGPTWVGLIPKNHSPLKVIIRSMASNYLQYMFNLKPLMSDITGIYTSLTQLERRLNDFLTRAGRVQRRHFSFNWNELKEHSDRTQTIQLSRFSSINLSSTAQFERVVRPSSSTFHAMIEYNYNFTQYQLEHARILALLDYFGVNLNPAIIWNAVRWSFVVDWVFGVGQWLNSHKLQNMEPQINIRRYLWSVKRERQIDCTKTVRSSLQYATYPSPIVTSKVSLPSVTQKAYRRSVGLPSHDSIVSSGLTPTEFSLGAALVLAKSRTRRRRKK